jgi:hypothetical protein
LLTATIGYSTTHDLFAGSIAMAPSNGAVAVGRGARLALPLQRRIRRAARRHEGGSGVPIAIANVADRSLCHGRWWPPSRRLLDVLG